jgi:hypothetical protein
VIWLVLLGGIIIGVFLGLMFASMNAIAVVEAAQKVLADRDDQ